MKKITAIFVLAALTGCTNVYGPNQDRAAGPNGVGQSHPSGHVIVSVHPKNPPSTSAKAHKKGG